MLPGLFFLFLTASSCSVKGEASVPQNSPLNAGLAAVSALNSATPEELPSRKSDLKCAAERAARTPSRPQRRRDSIPFSNAEGPRIPFPAPPHVNYMAPLSFVDRSHIWPELGASQSPSGVADNQRSLIVEDNWLPHQRQGSDWQDNQSKVTLMQVEKECEASMRKQFQENQPKKPVDVTRSWGRFRRGPLTDYDCLSLSDQSPDSSETASDDRLKNVHALIKKIREYKKENQTPEPDQVIATLSQQGGDQKKERQDFKSEPFPKPLVQNSDYAVLAHLIDTILNQMAFPDVAQNGQESLRPVPAFKIWDDIVGSNQRRTRRLSTKELHTLRDMVLRLRERLDSLLLHLDSEKDYRNDGNMEQSPLAQHIEYVPK